MHIHSFSHVTFRDWKVLEVSSCVEIASCCRHHGSLGKWLAIQVVPGILVVSVIGNWVCPGGPGFGLVEG